MPTERERRSQDWILLLALVLPTVAAWVYFVLLVNSESARFVYAGSKAVQFALPVLWFVAVRRRFPRPFDLRPPRIGQALRGLGAGLVLAVPALAVYVFWLKPSPLAAISAERIRATLEIFHAATPGRFLLLAIAISVVHSWLEEYYWRWFVFQRTRSWMPSGLAIAVASLGFAAHHLLVVQRYVPPEQLWTIAVPATLAVAIAGAVWCRLFARTGSLLAPWVSHLVVDGALMVIGYDLVWGFR